MSWVRDRLKKISLLGWDPEKIRNIIALDEFISEPTLKSSYHHLLISSQLGHVEYLYKGIDIFVFSYYTSWKWIVNWTLKHNENVAFWLVSLHG